MLMAFLLVLSLGPAITRAVQTGQDAAMLRVIRVAPCVCELRDPHSRTTLPHSKIAGHDVGPVVHCSPGRIARQLPGHLDVPGIGSHVPVLFTGAPRQAPLDRSASPLPFLGWCGLLLRYPKSPALQIAAAQDVRVQRPEDLRDAHTFFFLEELLRSP